jgi:hypothetical protein
VFGLFKSASYSDPMLGELSRSRGLWRGMLQLESGPALLALAGTRVAPDPAAIALACEAKGQLSIWRSAIETALFEHYEACAEAVAAGEFPEASETFPNISGPPGVWPHASLEFVSVLPLDGTLTTELGFTTAWDEEHTLGARFVDGAFVELCGSVLPP